MKGWTGDPAMLAHLDKHGVLDLASRLMDEDSSEDETISAEEAIARMSRWAQ